MQALELMKIILLTVKLQPSQSWTYGHFMPTTEGETVHEVLQIFDGVLYGLRWA